MIRQAHHNVKTVVSIIIVNRNGKQFLKPCLDSVAKIKQPSFELIIVDNGSSDGSKQLVKNFIQRQGVMRRAIFNATNLGFCHANNQGAGLARGDYLLFLNNDTEVPTDLAEKLVNKLRQDKTIGIIQPKILLKDEPGNLDSVGGFLTWTGFLNHLGIHEKDRGQYDKEFPVLSPKGACMMIPRRLFNRVGGFDEDFFAYFEETDLAWRVWLAGKRVLYFPESSILHLMGRTTRQLEFDFIQFHSYKNRIASLIKNVATRSLWRVVVHMLIVLSLATFYILIGKFRVAKPIWRSLGWNVKHLGTTIKKRRSIQITRKVNDSFLKLVSKPINLAKAIHDVFYLQHESGLR